jgi:hypothetical protein
MNTISKFTLALIVFLLAASQVGCSETDRGKLLALGCQIYMPNNYDLTPNDQGNIHSMYAGADAASYPVIQYYPKVSFDDHASKENIAFKILSEEQLGHLRFLKVKFYVNAYETTWDVITSDSAFFVSQAMRGTEILDQFRACAGELANKSLNTETRSAGSG